MAGEYEEIGEAYLITKAIPWKRWAESYSLFQALGSLEGERVIDVACGDGFFTRRFARAGAAELVGVDLSERMIALARRQEEKEPLGVAYDVCDAADLGPFADRRGWEPFDVAASAWLFDYARTREHLRAICRSFAHVVRPGGRLVHMGGCFDAIFHHTEHFERFLPHIAAIDPPGDGAKLRWVVELDGRSCSAENTMWTPATITAELEAAGFADVRWPPPLLDPRADPPPGDAYWTEYLQHPYFAVTTAVRGGG